MSGGSKEKLQREEDSTESHTTDDRELYLRDGRKLVVGENDSLVEIRSASGMLELRIKLTEEGPVLQMESVRMQLKATESVEIAAKRVDIIATDVGIKAEESIDVVAENSDVRVVGKKIHLN
jgi:hypothetical protein